jgi:RimJ/RimL family protein N-acetyltransferase
MRQIVHQREYTQFFLDWINNRIDTEFDALDSRYLAYVKGDEVLAVVVFDHWTKHHVEVSIATDGKKNWASRYFITEVFNYAFALPTITRCNFVVEVENENAIRLHQSLGHPREGLLKDWFGTDKDAYLYRLTRREWEKSKWRKNDFL